MLLGKIEQYLSEGNIGVLGGDVSLDGLVGRAGAVLQGDNSLFGHVEVTHLRCGHINC